MICTILFCLIIGAPEQLYGPDNWPDGNNDEVGREFWIYGMYIAPYETQRYLMRWKVELNPEPVEGLGDKVELPVIWRGE